MCNPINITQKIVVDNSTEDSQLLKIRKIAFDEIYNSSLKLPKAGTVQLTEKNCSIYFAISHYFHRYFNNIIPSMSDCSKTLQLTYGMPEDKLLKIEVSNTSGNDITSFTLAVYLSTSGIAIPEFA